MDFLVALIGGGIGGFLTSILTHFVVWPLERQREAKFEIRRLVRTYHSDLVTPSGVGERQREAAHAFKAAAGGLVAAYAFWPWTRLRDRREQIARVDRALHSLSSGVLGPLTQNSDEDRWRKANLRDIKTIADAMPFHLRGVTDDKE